MYIKSIIFIITGEVYLHFNDSNIFWPSWTKCITSIDFRIRNCWAIV